MRYFQGKDLVGGIRTLHQAGGTFRKAATQVRDILMRIKEQEELSLNENPLRDLKVTNHGESRILKCVKYELSGASRLITVQDSGMCVLCFAGNHTDCDKWLARNAGIEYAVDKDNRLVPIFSSQDINQPQKRIFSDTDLSEGLLYKKIPLRYYDRIASHYIPRSLLIEFENLESTTDDEKILELAMNIDDERTQNVFYDTFTLLRQGKIDEAKDRIDLFANEMIPIENIPEEKIDEIEAGEHLISIEQFEPEDLDHFIKTASFQKWMLFLHPEQRKIVERDFSGPAKLTGVSGSGKTCVIVKRAIRLARKYSGEKLLIITLNRSLARLIRNLIEYACPETSDLRSQIDVKSFWELCQEKLCNEFEPENKKSLVDTTWRTQEHIDDIWREYYHCENNNDDARVLFPVHKSLLARNIYPQEYIYQEFVWIRSALAPENRNQYLEIERSGRSEPFLKEYREMILKGLLGWERKMKDIGAIDYLGLATSLHRHLCHIKPEYRCILVDEVQDFGTIELRIIRQLVEEGENDIFVCGDISQQVNIKHLKMADANIDCAGRSFKIEKNYRNSREILLAAYTILHNNLPSNELKSGEFEILDPYYSDFSTPKPLILSGSGLSDELARCYNYLKSNLQNDRKAVMAICGYTLRDVENMGKALHLPVLNENIDIDKENIFLSDLEQTKGFEFDTVCILNCSSEILPNPFLPVAESYREISKLYVAMTRAKLELIISYSAQLSSVFKDSEELFTRSQWSIHEANHIVPEFIMPAISDGDGKHADEEVLNMSGRDFLYTKSAVGMTRELIDKMDSVITGTSKIESGKQKEWATIKQAIRSIGANRPIIAQVFGPETLKNFETFFEKFGNDKKRPLQGVTR